MLAKKENFLDKIVKKDYQNELEKILEEKDFSENVKSILLSIMYKIEAAYKDLQTVKRDVEDKEQYEKDLIEIIKNTSLINKLKKLLNPIMKILFPNIKKEDKEYDEISMNIVANLLGIGNAATPLGIKAMQTMQEKNKEKSKLTDSMVLFIVLNTASIQIIPTTVIAIRNSLGSQNPTKIIIPVWIATICAAVSGITLTKLLLKINRR